MVSVAGYALAEYLLVIVLSYGLILVVWLSEYIRDYMLDRSWWRSVVIYTVLLLAGILVYSFDIRFGVVWMFNGMLLMRLGTNIANIVVGMMNDGDEGTIEY